MIKYSYNNFIKEVFTTIYERILAEQQWLENQIHSLETQLKSFPEGKIICARNENRYKWYHSDGHTSTYLPKNKIKLAEQLAAKKYYSLLLEDLRHEKKALDSYLEQHDSTTRQAEKFLTDMPEYRKLLSSTFKTHDEELLDWINLPYEHNPKHPEQLIHKTISGNYVRSKSEALIDMILYMNKIPFRYECALSLGETTIYPDFTIKHPQTGEIYYWEHFGMMDEPSYYKNAYSKLLFYTSNQIIPTIQLITTYETKQHPLSSETVDHLIREYFC